MLKILDHCSWTGQNSRRQTASFLFYFFVVVCNTAWKPELIRCQDVVIFLYFCCGISADSSHLPSLLVLRLLCFPFHETAAGWTTGLQSSEKCWTEEIAVWLAGCLDGWLAGWLAGCLFSSSTRKLYTKWFWKCLDQDKTTAKCNKTIRKKYRLRFTTTSLDVCG